MSEIDASLIDSTSALRRFGAAERFFLWGFRPAASPTLH
jgi:hypothetical protein